jgi:thiol-disulfide isomerase/thioredoxin
LNDTNGKAIALSSLQGKVVLVDFWASWCMPCRQENPNVVRMYEKYKDKGFTVYSVSLDESKDAWVKAIKDDNLSWPNHVSDLKGWQSSAAALYGVSSIPATFLLDKEGNIIAQNLRGAELEQKLQEILD